jgi:50S ribosomal protein L16 3-hydroxylase
LAVSQPARIPDALAAFASKALAKVLKDDTLFAKNLGEHLTEPKPSVWFEAPEAAQSIDALKGMACQLDQRSRMMYDEHFVYVNGESYLVTGQDAPIIRLLANQRMLSSRDIKRLSSAARQQLTNWLEAGWISLMQG